MIYLTNENVSDFLNTGNELTAQNISGNLEELCLGVSKAAYIHRSDATPLFYKIEDQSTMYYDGRNHLFVHLTPAGLAYLLDNNTFVITDDEE